MAEDTPAPAAQPVAPAPATPATPAAPASPPATRPGIPPHVPSAQEFVRMSRFEKVNEAKKAAEARIAELEAAAARASELEAQLAAVQVRHAQDLALQSAATTAPHLAHPEVQDLFRSGYQSYVGRAGTEAQSFGEWLASDAVKGSPVYSVYLATPAAPAAPAVPGQPAAPAAAPPVHAPPSGLNAGTQPAAAPVDPYSPAAIDAKLAGKPSKAELLEIARAMGFRGVDKLAAKG